MPEHIPLGFQLGSQGSQDPWVSNWIPKEARIPGFPIGNPRKAGHTFLAYLPLVLLAFPLALPWAPWNPLSRGTFNTGLIRAIRAL